MAVCDEGELVVLRAGDGADDEEFGVVDGWGGIS